MTPDDLDLGVRDLVVRLNALGFVTTDSGDGVTKPADARAFDVPHVICRVEDPQRLLKESYRLWQTLPSGWKVEASYDPADRVALLIAQYLPAGTDDRGAR